MPYSPALASAIGESLTHPHEKPLLPPATEAQVSQVYSQGPYGWGRVVTWVWLETRAVPAEFGTLCQHCLSDSESASL